MLSKIPFAKSTRRSLFVLAAAGAVLAGSSGCVSKEFTYKATVAGGEELTFTLGGKGPEHARAEGFEILDATLLPDYTAKTIYYSFRFSDAAGGKTLRSVKIEDVSDAAAITVFEDNAPQVVDRTWAGKSAALSPEDPSLTWISYVSDSMRVYRFTLTLADGRKVVLNQLSMTPGWVKTKIREMFGLKY